MSSPGIADDAVPGKGMLPALAAKPVVGRIILRLPVLDFMKAAQQAVHQADGIRALGVAVQNEIRLAGQVQHLFQRIRGFGGGQAMRLRENLLARNDPQVFNAAEMGVGLNPQCSFMGFMLEDEGVAGSVHIGIGTSITLGGTVKAACHYDLIMTGASIEADGRVLLRNGQVQYDALGL